MTHPDIPELPVLPVAALVEFAQWIIREHVFGGYDLDGGSVQDKAHALGLLVEVSVPEPCSENCSCAEFGCDFPINCFRLHPALTYAATKDRHEQER
jgi:hypothetical protein